MADTKEQGTPSIFGTYTPEQDAAFDKAAAQIIQDEPEEEVPFDVGQPTPREAPEVSESSVDHDALEDAHAAYRRDGLTDDEIEARLQKLGAKQFLQKGLKRAKKHREDDDAYAGLKQLRATEPSSKGTASGDKGERSQAGTPALNLQEVAAPLAERLGLDEAGKKELVAYGEAALRAKDAELNEVKRNLGMLASVLQDNLLEEVRTSAGLDQIDDEDWFRVQEVYQQVLPTNLHGDLSGKPRMKALLKAAAKFLDVKGADPEEIQRQASVAKAKAKGSPIVSQGRKLPEKSMSRDEIFDHMGKLITQGKFKGQPPSVVREYAERLRAQSKK